MRRRQFITLLSAFRQGLSDTGYVKNLVLFA
jgi:hypothetical protein